MKANGKKAVKQSRSWQGNVLTMSYPTIGKSLVIDTEKYTPAIRLNAEHHGFDQKYGDAKSGKSALEKYQDACAIHASLLEGNWTRSSKGPDLTPLILEAVARVRGLVLDLERRRLTDKKTGKWSEPKDEHIAQWATDERVKSAMLDIKAERAKAALKAEPEMFKVPGIDA